MSHDALSQFLDGLRPAASSTTPASMTAAPAPSAVGRRRYPAHYAEQRGWLTPTQAREVREGRVDQLAVGGYRIFDKLTDGPAGVTYKATHPALQLPVSAPAQARLAGPLDNPTDYLARTHAATLVLGPHVATVLDAGTYGRRHTSSRST